MHFFYDAQSRPAMVKFNGALYSYIHNLQGDVVGIVDSAGSLVVEYKYDAWGKPTLVRTLTTAYEALAELNPFRYRGYVWDGEEELYFLRNRFYNSKYGRFLNVDSIIGGYGQNFPYNVFVYCINNPMMFIDENGFMAGGYVEKLVTTDWNAVFNTIAGAVTGFLGLIGITGLIDSLSEQIAQSQAKAEAESKAIHDAAVAANEAVKDYLDLEVYRWYGMFGIHEYVPTPTDTDGLSFSTRYRPNSTKTTIGAILATGMFSVEIKGNHVSVFPCQPDVPRDISMKHWMQGGIEDPCTITLFYLCTATTAMP